ncbi:MAG: hypothetical protein ACRD82_23270, partial [Blastocatellia bacterium]
MVDSLHPNEIRFTKTSVVIYKLIGDTRRSIRTDIHQLIHDKSMEIPKTYEPKDVENRWYPFWEEGG